jgi:hypothetical protein
MIHTNVLADQPLPALDDVRRRLNAKVPTTPTVADSVEVVGMRWLAGRRKIRRNTFRSYESHLRLYLIPHLPDCAWYELKVEHFEKLYDDLETRNNTILMARESGDPSLLATVKGMKVLDINSIHRVCATARKFLNDMRRRHPELMPINPVTLVELPTAPPVRPVVWTGQRIARWKATGVVPGPVMVWTPKLTGIFLDAAAEHPYYHALHAIAYRGLRRGEACAIRDDCIDPVSKALTIDNQRIQLGWEVEDGDPKTQAGERLVALDDGTLHALQARQAVRDAERILAGAAWKDTTGLLLTEADGTPVHPAKLTDAFREICEKAGLPPIRLHDLRHTAATLALAAGVDIKVIQEMLGHSCLAVTADIYTSVLSEIALEAADAIAAIVPRNQATLDPPK